uniref:PH domain-containing protein n=1 Tax=Romanomermis culicivorax TaxID=13658 RepID=A0A915I0P5_ROMCU
MFYEGVQAEDDGNCTITIDLSDCTHVLPVSVTKNYGIELRLKNSRYTLSAMTPGIRDSWINAIKHALYTLSSKDDKKTSFNEESFSCQNGKRVAYVTPESHNWFATTTDDSCSTTDDETLSLRSGSNLNDNQGMIFGSDENLSVSDQDTDKESEDCETESRRRSVSPTCRRSPVSRIKERNSRRKQGRRSDIESDAANMISSNDAFSPIAINRVTNSVKSTKRLANSCNKDTSATMTAVSDDSQQVYLLYNRPANNENYIDEKKKIEILESQLEMVKSELKQAKDYLQKNNKENCRLLKALSEK